MTDGPSFRKEILNPKRSPAYMRGPLFSRYLYTFGATHDHFAEYVWAGVGQRFPRFAGPEARKALSRDRDIPIYEGEPVPSQRERLRTWRSAHRLDGTPGGIMKQLRPYFVPQTPLMRIVAANAERAMWATYEVDGSMSYVRRDPSNWDWDSEIHTDPQTIHRWWLIIYPEPPIVPQPLDVQVSETSTIGSTLLIQQALDTVSIGQRFQRLGAYFQGLILAFDPASFDPNGSGAGYPDGTWWRTYKNGQYNRLETARYYEETSTYLDDLPT